MKGEGKCNGAVPRQPWPSQRSPRRQAQAEAEPGARPSEGAMSPGATSRCSRPLPTGALRRGLAARGLLVSLSFLKTKINSVFKHVHHF